MGFNYYLHYGISYTCLYSMQLPQISEFSKFNKDILTLFSRRYILNYLINISVIRFMDNINSIYSTLIN